MRTLHIVTKSDVFSRRTALRGVCGQLPVYPDAVAYAVQEWDQILSFEPVEYKPCPVCALVVRTDPIVFLARFR